RGRHTELLLEGLHELGELEHGHRLDRGQNLCNFGGRLGHCSLPLLVRSTFASMKPLFSSAPRRGARAFQTPVSARFFAKASTAPANWRSRACIAPANCVIGACMPPTSWLSKTWRLGSLASALTSFSEIKRPSTNPMRILSFS